MRYIKAEEILPKALIEQIQEYADGVTIYIPRKAENRLNPNYLRWYNVLNLFWSNLRLYDKDYCNRRN